jgi:hypothetical protein
MTGHGIASSFRRKPESSRADCLNASISLQWTLESLGQRHLNTPSANSEMNSPMITGDISTYPDREKSK